MPGCTGLGELLRGLLRPPSWGRAPPWLLPSRVVKPFSDSPGAFLRRQGALGPVLPTGRACTHWSAAGGPVPSAIGAPLRACCVASFCHTCKNAQPTLLGQCLSGVSERLKPPWPFGAPDRPGRRKRGTGSPRAPRLQGLNSFLCVPARKGSNSGTLHIQHEMLPTAFPRRGELRPGSGTGFPWALSGAEQCVLCLPPAAHWGPAES